MACMSWVRSRVVAAALSTSVVGVGLLPGAAGATTTGSTVSVLYPYVDCVSAPLDGDLWGVSFGYVNTGDTARFVSRGASNLLAPQPAVRPGQPTNFLPGLHPAVLSTYFDPNAAEGVVSWSVLGVIAEATTAATRCEQEVIAPAIAGTPTVGRSVAMAGERVQLLVPGYDVTYRWYRDCDTAEPVHVADGRSYFVLPADAGHRLQGVITYSRSVGDNTVGLRVTTPCGPTATAGAAPVATEAPVVSGRPMVGQPLSVTGGSWSGSLPTTEQVEWEVCDSTCAVAGTETTYTPDADDQGKSIRARVTRTNVFGSGAVTTAAVGPVRPAAPQPGMLVPSSVGFPDTAVGRSAETTIYYLATTPDPVTLGEPSISGPDAASFRVVDDNCESFLPVHGGCAIEVAFEPASAGSLTAELHLDDGAGVVATLTGRAGVAPSRTATPSVAGAPAVGAQLTVTGGDWAGDPTVTVGWEACSALACSPVGAGPSFTPGTAEVGASIRAVLTATNDFGTERFVTAAVGPVPGPPAPPGPPTPPALAALSLGAARLDLGKVRVGKQGKTRTVQVTSVGGSPLLVQSVLVSGKHRKDVVLTTTCPGDTLAAGAACAVTVRLKPAAAGRRAASLVVTTTAGTQTVALTGQGLRKKR